MSRTFKDKPSRLTYESNYNKEDLPKVKKDKDNQWHWLQATPSWWTNLFMNRPIRRCFQAWEREVEKLIDIDDVEDMNIPHHGKKPHKYYW